MDCRLKDVVRLVKKIEKLTDGQASIDLQSIDWDGIDPFTTFKLQIRPNGGHYKGGIFDFTVTLPFDYPSTSPPVVWCNTRVYHPNIDIDESAYFDESSTNVCLNLFEYGTWQASYSLDLVVLGLVFLFHHPNLDDPLAEGFSGNETEAEFAENVRKYMAGEVVNEMNYETNFRVVNGVVVEKRDMKVTKTSSANTIIQDGTSENSDNTNESTTDDIESSVSSEPSDIVHVKDSSEGGASDSDSASEDSCPHDKNNNSKYMDGKSIAVESFSETPKFCEKRASIGKSTNEFDGCKCNISDVVGNHMCDLQSDTEIRYEQYDDHDGEGELALEYIEVDGEYILKPKSIDIKETGVLKCDKDLVFRECDFDVDLESSIDTGSMHKPRDFCSCFQPLCRLMLRMFSRCRRSK